MNDKLPTKKFENGETITIAKYLDFANYGTSIAYLQALNWGNDQARYKHLAEVFSITIKEAEFYDKQWQAGECDTVAKYVN